MTGSVQSRTMQGPPRAIALILATTDGVKPVRASIVVENMTVKDTTTTESQVTRMLSA